MEAPRKRWDGKVITTSRQWNENALGAIEPSTHNLEDIYANAWATIRSDCEFYGSTKNFDNY